MNRVEQHPMWCEESHLLGCGMFTILMKEVKNLVLQHWLFTCLYCLIDTENIFKLMEAICLVYPRSHLPRSGLWNVWKMLEEVENHWVYPEESCNLMTFFSLLPWSGLSRLIEGGWIDVLSLQVYKFNSLHASEFCLPRSDLLLYSQVYKILKILRCLQDYKSVEESQIFTRFRR